MPTQGATSTAMIDLHAYKGRQAAIAASPDAQCRDDLVIKYMPLVHYVVNNLALSLPPMLDTDDILSYGTMGLIDAIDRFDASRCVKFETYAVTRVRGYIIDQLRALDWIPRSARQRARQIEKAHDEIQRETGHAPTAEQVKQRSTKAILPSVQPGASVYLGSKGLAGD